MFEKSQVYHPHRPRKRRNRANDLGSSVVHSVVGRKQPVAQEIVRGARPRFVGVAAEVGAKRFWMTVFVMLLAQPSFAQRATVVRGVGTQLCARFLAGDGGDKQFGQEVSQWILGVLTGYFHQADDDASRTMGDSMLVETVVEVCKKNAEKTIDQATTMVIQALPLADAKKPIEKK